MHLCISAAFKGCALQCLSNSLWFPEFVTWRNRPISQGQILVINIFATQHKAIITRWSVRIWEQFCKRASWWRLYYICIEYDGERTASKGTEMLTFGSSFWVMAVTVCLRKKIYLKCHNRIITYDHRSRNAFTYLPTCRGW